MADDFRGLQETLRQLLLAQIRDQKLTGLQLARETGFRQAHISNFLNRKRGLSLEAMDTILKARHLRLTDLFDVSQNRTQRTRSLQASSPGVTSIPIVTAENCLATEVPYSESKNALSVMSSRLEILAPAAVNGIAGGQRFVAVRISRADASAMSPRLSSGALAIIDRHAALGEHHAIYAIKLRQKIQLRYVERVGRTWLLRAESTAVPLIPLDSLNHVIGRVCLVLAEV